MDKVKLKEETVHGTYKFPLAVYRQESDEEFYVKLHWHEETEILFLERGKFIVHINMKKSNVEAPAILFVGAGDIHSIMGEPGCRENAVVFDMDMLSFGHYDSVQYKLITPLLEKRMLFPHMITSKEAVFGNLSVLYHSILEESKQETTASYIRVKAYLYEILAWLYENGNFTNMADTEDYDNEKIENIKIVLAYIHENYNRKMRIQDMAERIRMNEQYFCRYFKKITGKTPTQFINEVRIEKAAVYLQQSNRKIIDIAMECGYDNMGYFIKRFKKQKGDLPSEFRKKSQNSVIDSQNV